MANYRIINGKNTRERMQEEFQKLLEAQEHISVAEFARRVGISRHAINHRYKEWAEKVRLLRVEGRRPPRKRTLVTQSVEQVTEVEQAVEVITRLRKRISELERELSALKEEEDSRKKRVALDNQLRVQKAQNERLRGIIISLQQEILRYTPPELSRRRMKMIEEHAGATDEDEDEDVE